MQFFGINANRTCSTSFRLLTFVRTDLNVRPESITFSFFVATHLPEYFWSKCIVKNVHASYHIQNAFSRSPRSSFCSMENDFVIVMLGPLGVLCALAFVMLWIICKGWDIRRNWCAYYDTPEWKAKREEAFAVHGRRCAVCGTDKNLQVHHLRYWKWGFPIQGRENATKDLRVLCKEHHPGGLYSAMHIRFDKWCYNRAMKKRSTTSLRRGSFSSIHLCGC